MKQECCDLNLREMVIECLVKVGVIIDESVADPDISEYGIDSISYVTFIIELEDVLGVELPESVFNYDVLRSLNGFVNLIDGIVSDDK